MVDVPLRCRCGQLTGTLHDASVRDAIRFVCYCTDCRAFAHYLGREDVLDAAGGTDIVHVPASRVRLARGLAALRCVQRSPRVYRWYAACCRTPIANTAGPQFPVIALLHVILDPAATGRSLDELFGRPVCRIFGRSATGAVPDTLPPASLRVFVRRGLRLIRWRIAGLHRPSPFFDEHDRPRAAPVPLPAG